MKEIQDHIMAFVFPQKEKEVRGKHTAARKKPGKLGKNGEFRHVSISADSVELIPLSSIRPSPKNDQLYRPVDPKDPDFIALAQSISKHGVKEPLVVSLDGFILSGHRRFAAATLAGLQAVPCRRENILSTDPAFLPLLREFNRQRVKGIDEVLREEIVSTNPEEAFSKLRQYRRRAAQIEVVTGTIEGQKHRAEITEAKGPFLTAIQIIIDRLRDYWPLSDRLIHYQLLNDPPLIHARKRNSTYRNDQKSYKSLCELLTRARIAGLIPFEAIDDPTRTITTWDVFSSPRPFIKKQLEKFLAGYWRDLQRSQPCHVEIVGEKNTVEGIIKPVAADYCLPYTLGRGYSSLPPGWKMQQRFLKTGKEKLVLLVLSDHDPEGNDIPHAFARSMRDDFGIRDLEFIKVALTADQVEELQLPPGPKASDKESSRRFRFIEAHGENVFELEAVAPERLQQMLRETIESVINMKLFTREQKKEREDAAYLEGVRKTILDMVSTMRLNGEGV